MEADFSGYATKNDLKCSDGLTIRKGAFAHNDKKKVPLVWQHQHNDPGNVLGHAILENRADGVYAYAYFNESEAGKNAKLLVKHGDVNALSIYANRLVKQAGNVMHGEIQELSLVLSGANPGAFIDNIAIQHGEELEILEDEAVIYTGLELEHEQKSEGEIMSDKLNHADGTATAEETVEDVYNTLTDKQKEVVNFMVGAALEAADDDEDDDNSTAQSGINEDGDDELQHNQEGNQGMSRNVFEQNGATGTGSETPHLNHSQLETIMADARRMGSYKEAFLAHAEDYGITNIDLLFPDAKTIQNSPDFVKRRTEWVNKVLGGTKHQPFSRIKTLFADITHDEARAKGYIKGNLKKEEFFGLTKRVTTPQTVYKKQKLDRDDIIDVTDLDVVAWLKAEMRLMLEEEIARAILIGDGREIDDDDKIKDPASNSDGAGIRSIAHDHEFYAHPVTLATNVSAEDATEAIIRSMDNYRGSGSPTAFVARGFLTDLLLQKDKMGRRLYRTKAELAAELGVEDLVDVEILNNEPDLLAIIVNLQDYSVGTDRGGETTFFDDFDIDYNQYKYLYETRMSGALTRWKSAIIIKRTSGTLATPTVPTFNSTTGVVTIPTVTGVVYKDGEGNTLTPGAQTPLDLNEVLEVVATPAAGYYFPYNFDADWVYTGETELE